jgi:hypothetical protein
LRATRTLQHSIGLTMNTRTTLRTAACLTAALLAAALTGCTENNDSRTVSYGNNKNGMWPDFANNGSVDMRSTTLGPGGGSGDAEQFDRMRPTRESAEWNSKR